MLHELQGGAGCWHGSPGTGRCGLASGRRWPFSTRCRPRVGMCSACCPSCSLSSTAATGDAPACPPLLCFYSPCYISTAAAWMSVTLTLGHLQPGHHPCMPSSAMFLFPLLYIYRRIMDVSHTNPGSFATLSHPARHASMDTPYRITWTFS